MVKCVGSIVDCGGKLIGKNFWVHTDDILFYIKTLHKLEIVPILSVDFFMNLRISRLKDFSNGVKLWVRSELTFNKL